MAFILWPDVIENLELVLSWRQQGARFTLCTSELLQTLKTADDLMDSAPSYRRSLVTVITGSAPSVSAVFLLPSARCLSVCFIQKKKPSLRSVWTSGGPAAQSVPKTTPLREARVQFPVGPPGHMNTCAVWPICISRWDHDVTSH